jgi:hypothetical protein
VKEGRKARDEGTVVVAKDGEEEGKIDGRKGGRKE